MCIYRTRHSDWIGRAATLLGRLKMIRDEPVRVISLPRRDRCRFLCEGAFEIIFFNWKFFRTPLSLSLSLSSSLWDRGYYSSDFLIDGDRCFNHLRWQLIADHNERPFFSNSSVRYHRTEMIEKQ